MWSQQLKKRYLLTLTASVLFPILANGDVTVARQEDNYKYVFVITNTYNGTINVTFQINGGVAQTVQLPSHYSETLDVPKNIGSPSAPTFSFK
jgi:hypothetical protein